MENSSSKSSSFRGARQQNDRIAEGLRGANALDPITFINFFATFNPDFLPGSIDVGVENLFDRREIDVVAQVFADSANVYLYPVHRIRIYYRIDW